MTLVLAWATIPTILWGAAIALPGHLIRLWASGHLDKTRTLATGGPYAHTQHPLYLGTSIIAVALAVASGSLAVLLLVVAYFAAFYPMVIREEFSFLRARFGRQHAEWTAAVPAFVPRLQPAGPRSTRFRWQQMMANGEWKTFLVAYPSAATLLYLRTFLRS